MIVHDSRNMLLHTASVCVCVYYNIQSDENPINAATTTTTVAVVVVEDAFPTVFNFVDTRFRSLCGDKLIWDLDLHRRQSHSSPRAARQKC